MKAMVSIFALPFLAAVMLSCGSSSDDNTPVTPDPVEPTTDVSSTTGITSFSEQNIFSRNVMLPANYAMQGFSLDSDGSIWYTQSTTSQEQINWVKASPNKSTDVQNPGSDYMQLKYFGHGTNTGVEEVGSDRYLWIGAFASYNSGANGSTKGYWTEKVIGRVKYVKGKTVSTNECESYYYIGDYTDMHPSIDADNDILTINYADKSNSNYRCFVMYKLSEAKKASLSTISITCTDGFSSGDATSTAQTTLNVPCHDLTKLEPIARMKFLKSGYGKTGDTYYSWQGYDVYKNRLYYMDGTYEKNASDVYYSSYAYMTVFDFKGNIIEERTPVSIISNRSQLTSIGVTPYFGAMESEGVKVYKGKLYLAFTGRGATNSATDVGYYQNIFVYNPTSK
jgi:hypothetical protein